MPTITMVEVIKRLIKSGLNENQACTLIANLLSEEKDMLRAEILLEYRFKSYTKVSKLVNN